MDQNHEELSSSKPQSYWNYLYQFKDSKYLNPQPILDSDYVKSLNIQKPSDETLKKMTTLGVGVAVVAAGVSMTAASGGVMGAVVYPSITSAASALVLTPISKLKSGEDMSMTEVGKKAATYGLVGAITGPIGENLKIL